MPKHTIVLALLFIQVSCGAWGCAERTRFLTASDHFALAYEYKTAVNPKGTVILLHGLGMNLDEWYNFGKVLRKEGWNTLALDLRGHGFSTDLDGEEVRWNHLSEQGRLSAVKDVEAAVQFAQSQTIEGSQSLWIMGSSFGANLALVYGAEHPAVKGVVLFSPGLDFGGVKTQESAQKYPREGAVMIVAAEDDFGAVYEAGVLHGELSADKKLLTYPEGGHGAILLEQVEGLQEEVLAWLKEKSEKMPRSTSR